MLTREHGIAVYDGAFAYPDRLTRHQHQHYADIAEMMLEIYRTGQGKLRRELHRAIHSLLEPIPDASPRRAEAFCKLLDDASEYQSDKSGAAAKLRRQVYRLATPHHPLVQSKFELHDSLEPAIKQQISKELGESWESIVQRFFIDIPDFQPLKSFAGYASGVELLARYNVAQTQVALYDALLMSVWAQDDLKSILRYAKLAGLMHTITRCEDGSYRFDFDGPASTLSHTTRYGIAMARFIPGLLSCRQWRMQAKIRPKKWRRDLIVELDSNSGLKSPVAASEEFDSNVEAEFFSDWGPAQREGWQLERETRVLHQGQKVFVPDFTLTHVDGRQILLEVIGYWTPEYLKQKLAVLKTFQAHQILLAVDKTLQDHFEERFPNVIFFKKRLKAVEVVGLLNRVIF